MCGCGSVNSTEIRTMTHSKETSRILNSWIIDNMNRKLLVQSPIYDSYNDIIGYVTKNESENIVRIFSKNIKEILE
jgi:hypothetical protein